MPERCIGGGSHARSRRSNEGEPDRLGSSGFAGDAQHGADAASRGEVGEALVHLLERAPRGHETLEVETTGPPQRDEPRDLAQRVAAPEQRGEDSLAARQEGGGRRDLERIAEGRRADADGRAADAGRRDAGRDQRSPSGRLERVVDAECP